MSSPLKEKPLTPPAGAPQLGRKGRKGLRTNMTPAEIKFADHFIAHGVLSDAVTHAYNGNYSMRSASALGCTIVKRPLVDAYIKEVRAKALAKAVDATALTKEWVLDNLRQVIERAMQAEPVYEKKDGEMVPSGEYTFNAAGANRALELVGKELGMFIDRKEVRTGPLETLTDDELTAIVTELIAASGIGSRPQGDSAPPPDKPAAVVPTLQ